MNADTLIYEIREALDEPNANKHYYTNDRMLSQINALYLELADEMSFPIRMTNFVDSSANRQNEVASTADSPIHKMPSDFVRIYEKGSVTWAESSSDHRYLSPTTLQELYISKLYDTYNTSGTPLYYIVQQEELDYNDDTGVVSSNIVLLYPYPSAAGNKLELWYVAEPTALVSTLTETSPAGAATSPVFETRYHRILVWGVVVQNLLKRRKMADAQAINSKYYEPLYADMFHYYKSDKSITRVKRIKPIKRKPTFRGENFP